MISIENFDVVLIAVAIVGITGLVAGFILSLASKFFAVKSDERIAQIRDVLPGANCGACGYAGCDEYAGAVVVEGAKGNLCTVGGKETVDSIDKIMGTVSDDVVQSCAVVECTGSILVSGEQNDYAGPKTCAASNSIGGHRKCAFGCLGFGDCVKVCEYNAISIVDGVAIIDKDRCVGCKACTRVCPKKIIKMLPKETGVVVTCSNKNKGSIALKVCKESCIGCKKCEKVCLVDAIKVYDNCAKIDNDKCVRCGACVEVCPRKTIKYV